jgi:hypothetical protein
MKLLVVAVCVAVSLGAAELRIDHVTVAGMHLDEMRQAFTAATGIPTEYGGPHSNHATEMALVSFPDGSYLELMGFQANADPAAVRRHEWGNFLMNNAGPCAFALRVNDMAHEVEALKAAGVAVSQPENSGRRRPDGTELAWQTVNVGWQVRGTFFPFLITDRTPREKRAYPSGMPTTDRFAGVAQVVIGVHDLDEAIAQYRKAFHLPQPRRQHDETIGANLAWFQGTPIVLAKATDSESWLGQRVIWLKEGPVAFLLANGRARMTGSASNWFGHSVMWMGDAKIGWHLGILI